MNRAREEYSENLIIFLIMLEDPRNDVQDPKKPLPGQWKAGGLTFPFWDTKHERANQRAAGHMKAELPTSPLMNRLL